MTARRRTTWMITGLIGFAALAGGLVLSRARMAKVQQGPSETTAAPIGADTPLATLAEGIKRSDIASLSALVQRLEPKGDERPKALTDDEGADWIGVVVGLRAGYLKYTTPGPRAAAVGAVAPIMARFAVEPAPPAWLGALLPAFDLINSGLKDPAPEVRASALMAVGRLWSWTPGRPMTPVEERQLGEWKDHLHEPVLLRLADRDPRARAAAVACLGLSPLDALAAPAVAYLDDQQSGDVRHQVLVSFATRQDLLTDDMILKRLHDPDPGIPQLAELILKTRGLSKDQVALGRLIASPRPEMRASVVPLVKDHDELDPVVWLLRLSHDPDETVRTRAVEAMTGKDSPDLRVRLREMAEKDSSPAVRTAAGRIVNQLAGGEPTVSLPPLPGSPSLTPKAN
ncbi:MAG TPA: HEAT repeat domain-containing protein [Isosphaeraceae bacterium]